MARMIDEAGKRYGRLVVIRKAGRDKRGEALWHCHCDCGEEVVVAGKSLRTGNTKSCGCWQRKRTSECRVKNEAGNRYGRLVVVREAGRTKEGLVLWHCQCDCGKVTVVRGTRLRDGGTQSCGCLIREITSKRSWIHGRNAHGRRDSYPEAFTSEFREAVRSRDLHRCQICGGESSRALDVHHIDYDKENTTMENCVALCRACHGGTGHNREYWIAYFDREGGAACLSLP